MGKKKHRHQSRSRSGERHDYKQTALKRRSDSEDSYTQKSKKHRHRSRSQSTSSEDMTSSKRHKHQHRSRSSPSSSDESQSTRHKKHKNKKSHAKDKHRRSRSTDKSHKSKRLRSEERPIVLTPADMKRIQEEKKKEKELLKALETPEEKRARRLAKKDAKERKRKENMGWDEEYMGYTNTDNPFGDEHLLDTFVWSKKHEKSGMNGLPQQDLEKIQKHKMIENKIELEKVKKRRVEREKEREERDDEREMLQRQKEAEYYREWEQQEDNFHLNQAKLRSNIRIEDGRAKPIDLLAKYISAEDDDFAVEMHEPYTYLNGLTITDLEDLLEDIKVYMELELGKNVDYWKDITIITEEELQNLKKMDPSSRHYVGDRRSGMNVSVKDDVNSIFKGKTLSQLALLQDQINKKLKGGEGIDIGYWESLLQQLRAHMAKTKLRERHQEQLRSKLFKLKQEQGIESEPLFPIMQQGESTSSPAAGVSGLQADNSEGHDSASDAGQASSQHSGDQAKDDEDKNADGDDDEKEEEAVITEEDLNEQSYIDYDVGQYSPKILKLSELGPDTLLYDPEDDMKRLEFARLQLRETGNVKKDNDAELIKKARQGMSSEEAQFSVEMPLGEQTLIWSDKYRPRKPRFFNRVHTGFEWNKYNQTHYDIDNPPPKIVQGYKFNIFYPDLIDKSNTPEYVLTPLEDNKDFAMLKFKAGPPYEDIAFKVVNREWEYSYKRGFRCQFHNNIFQAWFHFKRYRYRR